jgi:hypothetical protein
MPSLSKKMFKVNGVPLIIFIDIPYTSIKYYGGVIIYDIFRCYQIQNIDFS